MSKIIIEPPNRKTIAIIVPNKQVKEALIAESIYVHDARNLDPDKCSTLMHLYMLPETSWIIRDENPMFEVAELEHTLRRSRVRERELVKELSEVLGSCSYPMTEEELDKAKFISKKIMAYMDVAVTIKEKIDELNKLIKE